MPLISPLVVALHLSTPGIKTGDVSDEFVGFGVAVEARRIEFEAALGPRRITFDGHSDVSTGAYVSVKWRPRFRRD